VCINAAASFDPTKPVYAFNTSANDKNDVSNLYKGYFQWVNPDVRLTGMDHRTLYQRCLIIVIIEIKLLVF